MAGGAEEGKGDQHRPALGIRPDPGRGAQHRGGEEADDSGPEPRGVAGVGPCAEPHQHLVDAPQQGAGEGDGHRPVDMLETRAHDQQHAGKAQAYRQPSPEADLLAEHRDRQRDHQQGGGCGDGVHVGERHQREGVDEYRVLEEDQQRTGKLQNGLFAMEDLAQALRAQHHDRQHRVEDVSDPENLRDAEMLAEHLAERVHHGESEHRRQCQ